MAMFVMTDHGDGGVSGKDGDGGDGGLVAHHGGG